MSGTLVELKVYVITVIIHLEFSPIKMINDKLLIDITQRDGSYQKSHVFNANRRFITGISEHDIQRAEI
jgi:hypothetical protein